jgi:hypothetical protein
MVDSQTQSELGSIMLPPIQANEPYERYVTDDADDEQEVEVPAHIPKPGSVLDIRVDLSYPVDMLEAIIKEKLRSAKRRRSELQARGELPLDREPSRIHVRKLSFYLQVFDRHSAGEPFRMIARALKQRKSTVQYAYVTAIRFIGEVPVSRCGNRPDDNAASIRNPDAWIRHHVMTCRECKSADSWGQFCEGYRSFVTSNFGLEFVHFEDMASESEPDASEADSVSIE